MISGKINKDSASYDKMIAEIADFVHERFRKRYLERNKGTRIKTTKDGSWIKRHGTDQADLAKLNYSQLPSDWQKERWLGAKEALDMILGAVGVGQPLDEKFIESASAFIHEKWLERNADRANDENRLQYERLSDDEKEKDRIFIRAALEVYQSKNNNETQA